MTEQIRGTWRLLPKATCRRSDVESRVQAHGVAMIIIQVIDLKTATSSLAAEMPPQFEVNSLNFNLVAL